MISNWFKKLKFEDSHPTEETLLACVDGELPAKETARVRTHLENCWSCRATLDEIEETITLFVNFRSQIQKPLSEPPNNWSNFNRKLAELSAELENEKISIPNRLDFWQRFRQTNFAEWSPLRTQIGIGTVAAVLIVALLWQMVGVRNVSAAEILENSIRFQKQKIEKVDQPVIYQKLRLERVGKKSVNWETWHDAKNSRYRQALADERNGRRFISATLNAEKNVSPDEPVMREIAGILEANRMNPQQPLSAESFRVWRDSLAEKVDEVEYSRLKDGEPIYTLKTTSKGSAENGKIIEALLTVRANDWHTERFRLSVKNENGISEYEFVETAFEVVSLPSLSPEIFPYDPKFPQTEIASAATPNANTSPDVSPSPSPEDNVNAASNVQSSPSDSTANATPATAELEVEVLKLLGGIDADIGEEATVKRNARGELLVQGVVESRERKSEILSTLAAINGQPGLIIRIETSQEAQKRIERERNRTAVRNKPNRENDESVSVQPLVIRDAIPVDAEVRRYLRSKGTAENSLTSEVNRFATATLNRSNRILLRALALKNLANRFSETQLRSMKPEAKNEWLNLIATRAGEIENQNATLRQELGAVFGGVPAGGGLNISDEADLKRAVIRLSDIAAGNDRTIRAAFTFSAGRNADAVNGTQFRQSLGTVEGLANSIKSAVRRFQND